MSRCLWSPLKTVFRASLGATLMAAVCFGGPVSADPVKSGASKKSDEPSKELRVKFVTAGSFSEEKRGDNATQGPFALSSKVLFEVKSLYAGYGASGVLSVGSSMGTLSGTQGVVRVDSWQVHSDLYRDGSLSVGYRVGRFGWDGLSLFSGILCSSPWDMGLIQIENSFPRCGLSGVVAVSPFDLPNSDCMGVMSLKFDRVLDSKFGFELAALGCLNAKGKITKVWHPDSSRTTFPGVGGFRKGRIETDSGGKELRKTDNPQFGAICPVISGSYANSCRAPIVGDLDYSLVVGGICNMVEEKTVSQYDYSNFGAWLEGRVNNPVSEAKLRLAALGANALPEFIAGSEAVNAERVSVWDEDSQKKHFGYTNTVGVSIALTHSFRESLRVCISGGVCAPLNADLGGSNTFSRRISLSSTYSC